MSDSRNAATLSVLKPNRQTPDYKHRLRLAADAVARAKVDSLLVTHLPNVRYLCGFTGSSGVLAVHEGKWLFVTDGRYTSQAKEEVTGASVVISKGAPIIAAAERLSAAGARAVGIEAQHLTVAQRSMLNHALAPARSRETNDIVETLRMVKDAAELAAIRRAVVTGSDLLPVAVRHIKPGAREVDVAAELEYAARRAGAEAMSFETIVASGPRSALPHGRASQSAVPRNGFVVLDFGVILAGYCSDMTRTVHVGRAGREQRRLYDAVLQAQLAAIDAVRPGALVGDVDRAARRVLQRAGYGRYFTHSTGHGVGLEIHEAPRVGRGGNDVLKPRMVITIEPGAYVPGKGGVRIEDMVVVTEHGCEVLTPAGKDLIEI